MKRFVAFAILATFVAAPVFAQLTIVEDFTDPAFTDGASVKGLHGWDNTRNSGFQPELWDPENGLIKTGGDGTNALVVSTRDATTSHGGDLMLAGATGLAFDIPDISNQGTVYMKLWMDDNWNTAIALNGITDPTFCDGGVGCQGVTQWSDQQTIARFELPKQQGQGATGGEYQFDARDGTVYDRDDAAWVARDSNIFKSETWYEFWIQVDAPNTTASYYLKEWGSVDPPVALLNRNGSNEWGFRQIFNGDVKTLKFNISGSPVFNCDNTTGGDCIYSEAYIADIAVDTANWTTASAGSFNPDTWMENSCETVNAAVGDFNCDNFVNLTDLVTLGENYNQSGDYTMGDTNMDGLINLTDLVTLGENYNTEVETPEPASLGLLLAGGLLMLRRR